APHTRVAGGEPVLVDEVLPDRHGVAAVAERRLNYLAVRLARAGGRSPTGRRDGRLGDRVGRHPLAGFAGAGRSRSTPRWFWVSTEAHDRCGPPAGQAPCAARGPRVPRGRAERAAPARAAAAGRLRGGSAPLRAGWSRAGVHATSPPAATPLPRRHTTWGAKMYGPPPRTSVISATG